MIVECIKIEINNKHYSLSRHSLIITNKEKKKKLLRSHCFLSASSLIKMAKTCRFKVRLVIYFFLRVLYVLLLRGRNVCQKESDKRKPRASRRRYH